MAYDPNDPADKKIVADLIAAALETAQEEHEAEVTRLTNKNTELLGKLKTARAGGDNADEVQRLETELSEVQGKLRTAEGELRTVRRDLQTVTTERDAAQTSLESESTFARTMVVENGLTAALVEANVAPEFMEAARAMLAPTVTVKVDGDNRNAVVGDKPVLDYVKEWAVSDKGKHFVKAPANGGGNTQNNTPANGGGAKKIAEMNEAERVAHYTAVGKVEFERQFEAERAMPKT
jgi:hypothetical protein